MRLKNNMSNNREPLKWGSLEFQWHEEDEFSEGLYYLDIGKSQIQIRPEKSGHWEVDFLPAFTCTGHSPEEALSAIGTLIDDLIAGLEKIKYNG